MKRIPLKLFASSLKHFYKNDSEFFRRVHCIFRFLLTLTKKRKNQLYFQAKCGLFLQNKQTGQLIFSVLVTLTKIQKMKSGMNQTFIIYLKKKYLVSLLLFMCRTLKRLFRAKIRPWISLTSLWEILSHKSRFMLEKKWGCNLLMLLWDKSKYSNWFWSLNVSWKRNRKKNEYLHQICT